MSDIRTALGKGAVDYIMKPFTKDVLIGKIKDYLKEEMNNERS